MNGQHKEFNQLMLKSIRALTIEAEAVINDSEEFERKVAELVLQTAILAGQTGVEFQEPAPTAAPRPNHLRLVV